MKNRLRVLRAEREWSQADLAARLGVSRQTVNAIETGKYDPSLPLAFDMADLFKLRIEEIFRRDEKSLEEEAGQSPEQSPERQERGMG
jgi:putative transcriptional regulator